MCSAKSEEVAGDPKGFPPTALDLRSPLGSNCLDKAEHDTGRELVIEHPPLVSSRRLQLDRRSPTVLLVSPSCPVCLDGLRIVVASSREVSARNVAIHVVWVAVLADDSLEATSTAAAMFPDDLEAMHYWDGELQVSKAFHATLGLERWKRNVVWDLYLLYGARSNWTSQPVSAENLIRPAHATSRYS